MRTRLFALLTAALFSLFAYTRALAVEIAFYYPVAVGGTVAKQVGRLVQDFEREHPGITVTPIYAGTYKETLAKALTAHKGGTPPDVAVLFAADMYTLVDADAIISYDELAATGKQGKDWLGSFYPALMANSRAGGKTWGIPFQRSTILLYWNKDLFAKAGLDPNHPPATWAEMTAFAQKLTLRDGTGRATQWGLQIPSSGFPYWLFQGLTTANGAELMNAAGTETYFDQPAAVNALQYWVDLARVHKVAPSGIVEWGTTPDDFLAERAAMIWTSSGNLGNIKAQASFDFGVAMLPASKRLGSPTGGGNLYVFKKTTPDRRLAALTFVQWLAAPQRTAQWGIESGYIAVSPAAWSTPALKDHASAYPPATVARDQLQYAVAELSTHENQRVTHALNIGLAAALTGAKTPQQALLDAQQAAQRILLPYQR